MWIVLSIILTGVLQTFCLLLGVRWLVVREKREIHDRLQALAAEWVTPPAEGQPHKLAQLISAAGEVIGASAARSIMASLNADKSHVARVANGLVDEAQGAANPLLGLLAGGKRGKGAAMARLVEMIGPMLAGQSHGSNGGEAYAGRKHRD